MVQEIKFGTARAGMLIDGVADTPYVVATLLYDAEDGLHVAVPYVTRLESGQFGEVERWFQNSGADLPSRLRFQDIDGVVALFEVEYRGASSNMPSGIAFGRFSVGEAVACSQTAPPQGPLLITELQSEVDGLAGWTGFRAGHAEVQTDSEGRAKKLTITVESRVELEWKFEDMTLTLSNTWQGEANEGLGAEEAVILTSRFSEPKPAGDHIRVHDSIRSLIAIMFGTNIHFRRHNIKSDSFPRTLSSGAVDYTFHQFVTRMTRRDFLQPPAQDGQLRRPLVGANNLGVDGLQRWAAMQAPWSRVIGPVTGMLQRRQPFVEDTILTSSMAIEGRGHMLAPLSGEVTVTAKGNPRNPTFKEYALRCLDEIGLDWSRIAASTDGLAAAMAAVYNGVKHPDRVLPDSLDAALIGPIQLWVARLCIVRALDDTGDILQIASQHQLLSQDLNAFKWNNRYISESGEFVGWPS